MGADTRDSQITHSLETIPGACVLLQMWMSVPKGWMTAMLMRCVRTHPPPTSALASLATKGMAGSVMVGDLGTWVSGQQGSCHLLSSHSSCWLNEHFYLEYCHLVLEMIFRPSKGGDVSSSLERITVLSCSERFFCTAFGKGNAMLCYLLVLLTGRARLSEL